MISAPRGTHDILPGAQFGWRDAARWRHLESELRRISHQYGYMELRPPVFEATELFARGVGESTDIVQKEMFAVLPRGQGRGGTGAGAGGEDPEAGLTLRPEFTAGMVRAYIENGLHNLPQPTKIYTYGPAFRAERPQKGRFRQFHQWDVEVFGAKDPAVDAEVIEIGLALAARMGLGGLQVDLNSIGCPVCRPAYRDKLREHLRPHAHELCADCQSRLERSPLRILDCKEDADHPAVRSAPLSTEHLCEECSQHFEGLVRHLRALGVVHRVNPRIVRGLDYYTRTVFEVLHPRLGAQSTLWGGGRYDGLIELLGGRPTPGVGFALGMERLLMVLEDTGVAGPDPPRLDVFVAPLGAPARERILGVVYELRRAGLAADTDYLGRSLKAQLKYAGRAGARYVAIVGDDELARGACALRDMETGAQRDVNLESLVEAVRR